MYSVYKRLELVELDLELHINITYDAAHQMILFNVVFILYSWIFDKEN